MSVDKSKGCIEWRGMNVFDQMWVCMEWILLNRMCPSANVQVQVCMAEWCAMNVKESCPM